MADDIKTLKITTVGENKYTYEKEPGFPFTIVEGEVYRRVPAERYEIQFPKNVNESLCFGNVAFGERGLDDFLFYGMLLTLTDLDCMFEEIFILTMSVFTDGSAMLEGTLELFIEQGDYGRYVISETQAADEPVAFTFEPIYDYVLVD